MHKHNSEYKVGITLLSGVIILAISMLSMTFLPNVVFAQQSGEENLIQSSLLRFQNPAPSQATINAGQNVTFTGTIQSLVSADMTVSVSLQVNGTEGKDWNIIERNPSADSLKLTGNDSIPYEYKVQFLRQGIFSIQPNAIIHAISNRTISADIDANSPDCSGCKGRTALVTVTEQGAYGTYGGLYTVTLAVIAIAVSAGAVGTWYFVRQARRKGQRQSSLRD